ncbi:hypothetical protein [Alkalihalobacillus sp. LMS39]|uniref:hypothetical protein n=1 Tax=Alkalihalobacillus sp. LMS39 TaxID=2924032 RepID=UPI001FB49A4E|nr:hypothetical protein [Alkalihalobacillus sp. LMS39]UOE96238.1 hypothetical protein MM271_11810 [Alkalihalobacillus sp. LMS39]
MQGILKRSFISQTPVEIIYMSKNGTITQRKVTIQQLDDHLLIGFCHVRNQKRMFLIQNILSAKPVHRKEKAI